MTDNVPKVVRIIMMVRSFIVNFTVLNNAVFVSQNSHNSTEA